MMVVTLPSLLEERQIVVEIDYRSAGVCAFHLVDTPEIGISVSNIVKSGTLSLSFTNSD